MKSTPVRIQLTLDPNTRVLAFIIAILAPLGFGTVERILKTVCDHYGLIATRKPQ